MPFFLVSKVKWKLKVLPLLDYNETPQLCGWYQKTLSEDSERLSPQGVMTLQSPQQCQGGHMRSLDSTSAISRGYSLGVTEGKIGGPGFCTHLAVTRQYPTPLFALSCQSVLEEGGLKKGLNKIQNIIA